MVKTHTRMMAAACFAAIATVATAQSKLILEFGDDAAREIWLGKAMPTEKPATNQTSTLKVDLPLNTAKPGDKVFVWNRATGNLAVKDIKDILGAWKVADSEYKWIGLVSIQVLSGGKPVSAASIKLTDSKRSQTQLIDNSSNGVAEFYGVFPGQIKVETTYRLMGKTGAPNKISSELSLKRDSPDPTIAVALPEGVDVIAPKEEPKKDDSKDEADSKGHAKLVLSKPNRIVNFIFALLFVAVAAAGIYFAILWMRRNEDDVRKRLAKLGVQVPEPPEPADATPPPAVPVAPQPPQKIILDDSAPLIPAPSATPFTPAPGQPKLVADNGTVFNLAEGSNAVGREGSVEILLPGEGSVSRRHAEVIRQGSSVTVKDLGSTNGTFVNGVKINGESPISIGDTVQFGMVKLRFEG